MSHWIERRRFPRVSFHGIVVIRWAQQQIPCLGLDLSEQGILLWPRQADGNAQGLFWLTFTLPDAPRWISIQGRLVSRRMQATREVWGIEFIDVPSAARALLRCFVAQAQLPRALPRLSQPSSPASALRPEPRDGAARSDSVPPLHRPHDAAGHGGDQPTQKIAAPLDPESPPPRSVC